MSCCDPIRGALDWQQRRQQTEILRKVESSLEFTADQKERQNRGTIPAVQGVASRNSRVASASS
jgi:hypothetical protein